MGFERAYLAQEVQLLEYLLTQRRKRELDRQLGSGVALIEDRVDFDQIHANLLARLRDQLHRQVRLAVGDAAQHRRADAGCLDWIERIHIQANMEARRIHAHTHDRLFHHRCQPTPINIVHCEYLDAGGVERLTLARLVRPIHLGPYERIIVEGSRGSSLFVVQSGELEVIGKVDGKEVVLAHLGSGAVVGEVAFLTGQARTASVRATHGAVVLEIAPSHLEPIARARPGIIDQLTDLMALRRQSTDAPSRASVLQTLSSAILGRSWLVSEASGHMGRD